MAGKKKSTPIPLQSLDALFGTTSEEQAGIQQIALDNLHPFSNHPFKVLDDDKMAELSESVRTHGVLVPGIVRIKDTGGYEIIAGHRRKRACEIAGLKTMPVIIKDLTDCHSANYLEAFLSVYLETNSGSNSVMGILNYCCPAK